MTSTIPPSPLLYYLIPSINLMRTLSLTLIILPGRTAARSVREGEALGDGACYDSSGEPVMLKKHQLNCGLPFLPAYKSGDRSNSVDS
ncbi:uncharacterized protein L3040_008802 [Drepanopeziza brunnea f. sp. 'multigermtubi']|uniref:uncharacterized protein n=1 Tax=Drepanopeziza brunnea f. sp. 'multigermtubi' TaxID=698441 RepID=UPI0023A2615E|nr:hypothetical protein L3040_008802 [Drepanopeziza brunnea f. sp. 'multigermtubi']